MSGALVVIAVWLVLVVTIAAMLQRKSLDRSRRRHDETWGAGEGGTDCTPPRRANCGGGSNCGGGCGGGS
jgi:hypothetical protein